MSEKENKVMSKEALLRDKLKDPIQMPPVTSAPGTLLLLHTAQQTLDVFIKGGFGPPDSLVDVYLSCKKKYDNGGLLTEEEGGELIFQLNSLAFLSSLLESEFYCN